MATVEPDRRGAPGASAAAKAEAIRSRRERAAAQRGRTARIIRMLLGPGSEERRSMAEQHRRSTGAAGERMLAAELNRRCPGLTVLHDLRIPGTRANIDHVAIAPSGVYVIDAKRYRGRIRVEKPWFGKARLMIAGRNRTKLIAGLDKQVKLVGETLAASLPAEVPVHGCLCFIPPEGLLSEVGLPIFRTLKVDGYPLYCGRSLCKQLNRPGPLTAEQALAVQAQLASRFRPVQG
jgi:hypothetical protein